MHARRRKVLRPSCPPKAKAQSLPTKWLASQSKPSRPTGKSAHRNVASNNLRRLQRINSQETRVALRVEEGDRTPERLELAADEAARSGDLRTSIEYAGGARHTIQLWNELRTWDQMMNFEWSSDVRFQSSPLQMLGFKLPFSGSSFYYRC